MKLNEYESMILYYAKGHFNDKIKELDLSLERVIEAFRNKYYYADNMKWVPFLFNQNLIRLCFKLGLCNTYDSIISIATSYYFDPYVKNTILNTNCLSTYNVNHAMTINSIKNIFSLLAQVQVYDTENNIPLIEMTEKDDSFLQEYVDFMKEENK